MPVKTKSNTQRTVTFILNQTSNIIMSQTSIFPALYAESSRIATDQKEKITHTATGSYVELTKLSNGIKVHISQLVQLALSLVLSAYLGVDEMTFVYAYTFDGNSSVSPSICSISLDQEESIVRSLQTITETSLQKHQEEMDDSVASEVDGIALLLHIGNNSSMSCQVGSFSSLKKFKV